MSYHQPICHNHVSPPDSDHHKVVPRPSNLTIVELLVPKLTSLMHINLFKFSQGSALSLARGGPVTTTLA